MPNISISTAFDSGAVEIVDISDYHDLQLNIRADNASEFAQWFHFRLLGASGLPVTLRFLNAAKSAYPDGWIGYHAVASYDRNHWFRVPTTFTGGQMTVKFTPVAQSVYNLERSRIDTLRNQRKLHQSFAPVGLDRRAEPMVAVVTWQPRDSRSALGTPQFGSISRSVTPASRMHPTGGNGTAGQTRWRCHADIGEDRDSQCLDNCRRRRK